MVENGFISKVGLKVGPEDSIIEELINQKIAWEVYEIFFRRGGNLDYICPNGFEFYDRNMYLVNKFYKEFKEIIKESLITLNKNNLVERVGKENYEELVNMVNKYCSKEISLIKENKN